VGVGEPVVVVPRVVVDDRVAGNDDVRHVVRRVERRRDGVVRAAAVVVDARDQLAARNRAELVRFVDVVAVVLAALAGAVAGRRARSAGRGAGGAGAARAADGGVDALNSDAGAAAGAGARRSRSRAGGAGVARARRTLTGRRAGRADLAAQLVGL